MTAVMNFKDDTLFSNLGHCMDTLGAWKCTARTTATASWSLWCEHCTPSRAPELLQIVCSSLSSFVSTLVDNGQFTVENLVTDDALSSFFAHVAGCLLTLSLEVICQMLSGSVDAHLRYHALHTLTVTLERIRGALQTALKNGCQDASKTSAEPEKDGDHLEIGSFCSKVSMEWKTHSKPSKHYGGQKLCFGCVT